MSVVADGLDLYLALDLLKNVQDAVASNCATTNSLECVSSVELALNPQHMSQQLALNSLQRRVAPLAFVIVAGAGVVAFVAIAISAWRLAVTDNHIHVPAPHIAQATATQSISTVVYATASDDPNMVAVTQFATSVSLV